MFDKRNETMTTQSLFDLPVKKGARARIEFDGGTSCNIPRLGYGDGYGSYRIDGAAVRRVRFDRPMSCNAAEIATLAAAITQAKENGATALELIGDSQIALKWANVFAGKRKATKLVKVSDAMRESLGELREAMTGVTVLETKWQPRLRSVATFGH